jgi:beta-lactamase superfamily II metal-dependent hydrolase
MSKVLILDVAHGNCALAQSNGSTIIVDAPVGGLLLNTLEDLGIDRVFAAFISHADKDHLSGILSLLTSDKIAVDKLYVNPDSQKKTRAWRDFLAAVQVAEKKGSCIVKTSLSTTSPGIIQFGDAFVKVLAPSAALALSGVGSKDNKGRVVTSNSLSAVLKIYCAGQSPLLLAADLDQIGLDDALQYNVDLKASTVVFPHHGGSPGDIDTEKFVDVFLKRSKPDLVIFSNGRGRHDNPRKEIVGPIVKSGCLVACTQLSKRCSPVEKGSVNNYLEPIRAVGFADSASCAGSISLDLLKSASRTQNAAEGHLRFIKESVPTPMCNSNPTST